MNTDSEVFKLCLKWKKFKILARISIGKVAKRIIAPVKEYYCSEEYHGYIGIAVDH